jgi:hypothetical protein
MGLDPPLTTCVQHVRNRIVAAYHHLRTPALDLFA